ncbi:Mitochondrial transcription termination factor family protein [Melia azedarach]|uniref:Mitochondrial transcription termination factor family protein n=1 Tax=Melia azedarach TaxID=155640 RepID=A0ACC1X2G5_MELAZ|nr:Mitochondrial transcription termination factor family protein [Melia azedarach]
MDAEHMSENSPHFADKLVERFENELDIERLIARFLRYHPINEFEPFFESLGLEPFEYSPLLPRNLMFLSDDELLLDSYHVLCNYGVVRNKIGKIYKEAVEVFRYGVGILQSKLQAYEELGLSPSFVGKVIVCSPYLLIGDVNMEFIEVLERLKSVGIYSCWIEEHLPEHNSLSWSMIFSFLRLYSTIGFSDGELGILIKQHPGLLFEDSSNTVYTLIGLLLKFGCTRTEIYSMFPQFPQIEVRKFFVNLKQRLTFLFEIEMELDEIAKILCSHSMLLGSCTLKKTNTIFANLNVGKKRLCKFIQENPLELKKLVLGSRVGRLPPQKERSQMLKTKFLLGVGYVKNSKEMEKALQVFRGNGAELQERFDCIVNAGLDRKDVCEMIRVSPQILNITKDLIGRKIDFLVDYLGYPVSSLVSFPSYFNYAEGRIKIRLLMYYWLKDQGKVESNLAWSTVIAYSNKSFMQQFVDPHPKGPEVWQDLKKQICSKRVKGC